MDEIKLKLCPFCGKMVEYQDYAQGYSQGKFYVSHKIECKICGIVLTEQSRFNLSHGKLIFERNGFEIIMNLWNRRADHE